LDGDGVIEGKEGDETQDGGVEERRNNCQYYSIVVVVVELESPIRLCRAKG
jgi:hypothetical protein